MRTRLALAALALSALWAGSAASATAAPDPYGIFAKTRSYWLQQRYPDTLDYRVAISAVDNGVERTERYDSVYDALSNAISVDPVSDYDRAHPVYPGSSVDYSLGPYHFSRPTDPGDIIGVPRLAPNYSFGMAPFVPATSVSYDSEELVNSVRREFGDTGPSRNSFAPWRTIATVNAYDRPYHISMLGTASINGHDCYHLSLNPERDASRYRIREAWIDRATFAPWRIVNASNFRSGIASDIGWTIDFADVNGAHYIAQERANGLIGDEDHRFSSVAVTFEDIHPRRGPFPFEAIAPSSYTTLTEPQYKRRLPSKVRRKYARRVLLWVVAAARMGKWRNWQTRWI